MGFFLGEPLEIASFSSTDLPLVCGLTSSSSFRSSVNLPVRRRTDRARVDVSAAELDSSPASDSSSGGKEDCRRDERRDAVGVSTMPSKSSFFLWHTLVHVELSLGYGMRNWWGGLLDSRADWQAIDVPILLISGVIVLRTYLGVCRSEYLDIVLIGWLPIAGRSKL